MSSTMTIKSDRTKAASAAPRRLWFGSRLRFAGTPLFVRNFGREVANIEYVGMPGIAPLPQFLT